MKYVLSAAAIVIALLAVSAQAADGNVPSTVFPSLGLSGMKTVSDADGMQVRGFSGAAAVRGRSIVFGSLITPDTKSFVVGSDVNTAEACLEIVCPMTPSDPYQSSNSNINLNLNVVTETFSFNGYLIGGSGGSSFSWAQ